MKGFSKVLCVVHLFLVVFMFGIIRIQTAEAKRMVIRAWTVGPDDPSITRAQNLEAAGGRLNKILADVGSELRVKVETEFNTEDWGSFKQRNLLTLQSDDPDLIPDIICTGHEMIALYATAGYIRPLDDLIKRYWDMTYSDILPSLWDSVKYKKKIWGIPQDIEARLFWYRKDVLRKMGWSEDKIEAIPKRVIDGEFVLDDLAGLAKKMHESGFVKWGIYHRPTPGTDWFQFIYAYGGELQDPSTGKLVLDKEATLKMLGFMAKISKRLKVVPTGMTNVPWASIHKAFTKGEVGIFLTGGTWHWGEWKTKYKLSEDYMWENIGWALIPAGSKGGRPVSVSHPLTYIIPAKAKNPRLGFLIATLATSNDLNTRHAIQSAHLAIRESQVAYRAYTESKALVKFAKLLPYSRFSPNHSKAPFYWETIHQGISGVETDQLTPDRALEFILERLKQELGDELIVR